MLSSLVACKLPWLLLLCALLQRHLSGRSVSGNSCSVALHDRATVGLMLCSSLQQPKVAADAVDATNPCKCVKQLLEVADFTSRMLYHFISRMADRTLASKLGATAGRPAAASPPASPNLLPPAARPVLREGEAGALLLLLLLRSCLLRLLPCMRLLPGCRSRLWLRSLLRSRLWLRFLWPCLCRRLLAPLLLLLLRLLLRCDRRLLLRLRRLSSSLLLAASPLLALRLRPGSAPAAPALAAIATAGAATGGSTALAALAAAIRCRTRSRCVAAALAGGASPAAAPAPAGVAASPSPALVAKAARCCASASAGRGGRPAARCCC